MTNPMQSALTRKIVQVLLPITCDVYYESITDRSDLQPGDTISITMQVAEGLPEGLVTYRHLGIYIGNNKVIDYTSESKVRRISMNDFMENRARPVFRAVYEGAPAAYSPDEIVQRAKNFSPSEFGEYNLQSNNCEHFATYCTFGKKFSLQVEEVEQAVAYGIPKFLPLV